VTTVPASTLATLFNVTERYVRQLAQTRIIPRQVDGKSDLVGSVHGYTGHLEKRKAGAALSSERVRLLKAKADLAEQKRDQMRAELVPRDQVEQVWGLT